ncbi:phospholipid carrier-dependent glycosyltransferase [Arsenicicoccus piscis]|uniref:dolichyl-phosphate-mannose--protein mannosyltransferase n=1 Tax=Arsenicicoccus piscis TaxID=673954 RepID=UPI001F4C8093|nr:phospholipid carrier-dependent glycosyltransferase [Arsenicicoccus piscis]MCH8628025.1 phospholipid carrier-dependent glycosyltransferase [Arsenicicoccus piscis]
MARVTDLEERLLGRRPTDTRRAWVIFSVIAAIGGSLRMWRLGVPHSLVFDETYYVKDALALWRSGVELTVKPAIEKKVNELFTTGHTDIFTDQGSFVVHPPFGKWVIALGEQTFGIDQSFGWRFSVAVMGTLSILLMGFVARRLFGSTLLGAVAAVLLAFEGHHFVQSRTSLLDMGVMFWTFAAFCALVVDRDRTRARLARRLAAQDAQNAGRLGVSMGWRPWRLVAAVALALAIGTKWSGGFYFAAFGVLTILWDLGARRAIGERRPVLTTLVRDAIPTAIWMSVVVVGVYLATWTGWFRSSNGYDRNWADSHAAAPDWGWVPDALRSLWHHHVEMYNSARGITSKHDYMSNPWSWLVQGRPTSFFWEAPKRGEQGCTVDSCARAITSLGSPTLWWFATGALVVLLVAWALRRDWRAGAILLGVAAGYLPWFAYQDRTIFTFYAIVFLPYLVLAATYVLGMIIGRPSASAHRRRVGLTVVGAFVALHVVVFFFFLPVWSAQVIPYVEWTYRMWFNSWI